MLLTLLLTSAFVLPPVPPDSNKVQDKGLGFRIVIEADVRKVTSKLGSGDYSGITYLGGTRYAVVDDKRGGGGIVLVDMNARFLCLREVLSISY